MHRPVDMTSHSLLSHTCAVTQPHTQARLRETDAGQQHHTQPKPPHLRHGPLVLNHVLSLGSQGVVALRGHVRHLTPGQRNNKTNADAMNIYR